MITITVVFERDAEDHEIAAAAGISDEEQLANELQEACDAGILNGVFKVGATGPMGGSE